MVISFDKRADTRKRGYSKITRWCHDIRKQHFKSVGCLSPCYTPFGQYHVYSLPDPTQYTIDLNHTNKHTDHTKIKNNKGFKYIEHENLLYCITNKRYQTLRPKKKTKF